MIPERIDSQIGAVPRHVAIIMDGNGRWAAKRGLSKAEGHRQGAEAVREAAEGCLELGIDYLTLYAFSSENWQRPSHEVEELMNLFRRYLARETGELHKRQVRLRFIGERRGLPDDIVERMKKAEAETAGNAALCINLAVNYGSRDEILSAARRIAAEVKAGRLDPDDITVERFSGFLYTADLPPLDLVIRTSGEQRLSNFLLWQAAYAELVFFELYWPEFTRDTLYRAVQEFQGRDRRYGATSS